jgi:hypothetical protein
MMRYAPAMTSMQSPQVTLLSDWEQRRFMSAPLPSLFNADFVARVVSLVHQHQVALSLRQ